MFTAYGRDGRRQAPPFGEPSWRERGVQYFYIHSDPFLRIGLAIVKKMLARQSLRQHEPVELGRRGVRIVGGAGSDRVFGQMQELTGKRPIGCVSVTAREVASATYEERVAAFAAALQRASAEQCERAGANAA